MSNIKANYTKDNGRFMTDDERLKQDLDYERWSDKYDKITQSNREKENDNESTKIRDDQ